MHIFTSEKQLTRPQFAENAVDICLYGTSYYYCKQIRSILVIFIKDSIDVLFPESNFSKLNVIPGESCEKL